MSGLTRGGAEEMAENLTSSYAGFINHRLITEGCKHEYIWSKIDPSMDPSMLNDAILNVSLVARKTLIFQIHTDIQSFNTDHGHCYSNKMFTIAMDEFDVIASNEFDVVASEKKETQWRIITYFSFK